MNKREENNVLIVTRPDGPDCFRLHPACVGSRHACCCFLVSPQPQVHFFNSFFYDKLRTKGYEGVKRWTKNVSGFSNPEFLHFYKCVILCGSVPAAAGLGSVQPPLVSLAGQHLPEGPAVDPHPPRGPLVSGQRRHSPPSHHLLRLPEDPEPALPQGPNQPPEVILSLNMSSPVAFIL